MAYASWIKSVDPSTGSGNGRITVTGNENTGTKARSTTLTISAVGAGNKQVQVLQSGKPMFIQSDDAKTVAKEGANVTIEGLSNANIITYSLGTGDLDINLPTNYIANSITATNGVEITGKPGETKQFSFSVTFAVAANTTTKDNTRQLIFADENGHQTTCNITLTAGNPTLIVSVESVEMNYSGDAVTFDVQSNTNWSIV